MDQVTGQSQRLGHNQISKRRLLVILIIVGLAGLVWLAFGGTLHHEFLNYDDNEYVYENPEVAAGLSVNGILWAFTHTYAANWHPLTAISHMLDCQIYGLHPWGHHLTNVVLHALGAILLFLALLKLTGPMVALDQRRPAKMRAAVPTSEGLPDTIWPSAFVAALFAIHPLRVESVAWISERKDVLSGVFFMLTLLAYACYVRKRSTGRYLLVVLFLALGLLSKPTLVTLPFVLLLLDYWPLGRVQAPAGGHRQSTVTAWWPLIREKIPMFALAALSCVATIVAQGEALEETKRLGFLERAANALLSYAIYLRQLIYPRSLSVFYPYPTDVAIVSHLLPAALLLLLISVVCFRYRKQYPFLVVGWFWYLGVLVPMIGIMQVGSQGHADRYTYLTQIGLYLSVTWMAWTVIRSRMGRWLLATAAVFVIGISTALSYHETVYWRDTETLWRHALANTSNNYVAHNNLGHVLTTHRAFPEAILHFREAVRLKSDYAEAYNNLGNALLETGDPARHQKPSAPDHPDELQENATVLDEAIQDYQRALEAKPTFAEAWTDLATALLQKGQTEDAIKDYQKALELSPNLPEANGNYGNVLLEQRKFDQAITYYTKALELKPDYADAHYGISQALLEGGNSAEAMRHLQRVLELRPDYPEAHHNIGVILAQRGQLGSAIEHYEKAIQLKPNYAQAENNLGNALLRQGKPDGAIVHLRNAVHIEPDYAEAYNDLGSAFMQKNQVDQAIIYYQKAIQLRQDYAEAHSNLGNALLQKKDFDGAILQDKAALNFKPDSAPMQYNLGNAQAAKGNYADAISSYQAALQIQPHYGEVHNKLGLTLVALKENDRAIEEFNRALEINPKFADAHCNLGRLLAQLGRRDEAVAQFSEALRLRPNFTDAREQLRKLGVPPE